MNGSTPGSRDLSHLSLRFLLSLSILDNHPLMSALEYMWSARPGSNKDSILSEESPVFGAILSEESLGFGANPGQDATRIKFLVQGVGFGLG